MLFRDPISEQLRDIAWSMASRRREPHGLMPADPRDSLAPEEERRAGCLGLLRACARMSKALQRRIDMTADRALDLGASYGQVAEACGVSRQAARQRWLRRHQQQDNAAAAQLGAGPPDRFAGHRRSGTVLGSLFMLVVSFRRCVVDRMLNIIQAAVVSSVFFLPFWILI